MKAMCDFTDNFCIIALGLVMKAGRKLAERTAASGQLCLKPECCAAKCCCSDYLYCKCLCEETPAVGK